MDMLSKEEIGKKIRTAREAAGMTRPALSKTTGIPVKSIEKYEFGEQEPSMSRIGKIAHALEVSFEELTGVAEVSDDKPGKIWPGQTGKLSYLDMARGDLKELDRMREVGLHTMPRRASAMMGQILAHLSFLDAHELELLSEERGLYLNGCENSSDGSLTEKFDDLFASGQKAKAMVFCGNVAERIIDTSVIGVDLWNIDLDALKDFGRELEDAEYLQDTPMFWGNHEKTVPIIRDGARLKSILTGSTDFGDVERFPVR
jgi:transcriptional regulator with XRE-family HTH domain